jgi:hypothetical protein
VIHAFLQASADWDTVTRLPWRHFTSPLAQWRDQPSFLIGQFLFIACAAIALWHAQKQGRAHLFLWIAALLTGTANDLFFMALPLVDNFWQAQATIMLTARLPLYIPCVYVCFMYLPTVSLRRVGLPRLSRAAASGLLAAVYYAPYDIVGAKFLWWTWHDTDRPIENRLLGAPIGSTIWVITFVATFAYVSAWVIERRPELSVKAFALGLGLVALSSTPLMMLQMTIVQQLDGGVPGIRGLCVVVALAAALVVHGARRGLGLEPGHATSDKVLHGAVVAHFAVLVGILALFDPSTHVSTGVHQTYGACGVEARDISGLVRHEFLCADDYAEDFRFDCGRVPPAPGSRWYSLCGKKHDRFARFMIAVATLALLGVAAFSYLLRARPSRQRGAQGRRVDGVSGSV